MYCHKCGTELENSSSFCRMCGKPVNINEVYPPILVLVGIRPTIIANQRSLCSINIINVTEKPLTNLVLSSFSKLMEPGQKIAIPVLNPGRYKGIPLVFEMLPQTAGEYRIVFDVNLSNAHFQIEKYKGEVRVKIQASTGSPLVHVEINAEKFMGVDMSHMVDFGKQKINIDEKEEWWVVDLFSVEEEPNPMENAFRAKFSITESKGMRKVFIFSKQELVFGMAKRERQPEVDLTLRLLPIVSRVESPENWEKSAKISKIHGRVKVERGKVFLLDESLNGLFLRGVTEYDDEHIGSLGDWADLYGTLDEDQPNERPLVRIPKDEWTSLPDCVDLCIGKNILRLRLEVCRSPNNRSITAIHYTRITNLPQHEYIQLIDSMKVGHGANSVVRLQENDIRIDTAFEVFPSENSYWLRNLSDGIVWLDSFQLRSGTETKLETGSTIRVGRSSLKFEVATDDDFVTI